MNDNDFAKRHVLKDRRFHFSFDLVHGGQRYRVGLGRSRPGGRVEEVFLSCGKSGSDAETNAHDAAIILSIALQHGVPIEALGRSVTRDADGKPSGPIGAIIDLIVKEELE